MNLDIKQQQREYARWLVLQTLWHGGSVGASEDLILSTLQAVPMQLGHEDLRRALLYLADLKLVEVEEHRAGWHARILPAGVDVVEYTTPAPAGIARPAKYW